MILLLIIGVNGSPNEQGNTWNLLDLTLKTAQELGAETSIIYVQQVLSSVKNQFCISCCTPCTGMCYKNSKLEDSFELLRRADGIVLGSPVYFGTVSGQLKAFFDKTRKLRGAKGLYNKVGAGITVGASKYGGQETTMKALHDIMLVHGMIIVGDG